MTRKQSKLWIVTEIQSILIFLVKNIHAALSIGSYRLLIESIMNDISQLALFVMDKTDYGINFKQIVFERAQITSYKWLHETFLNQFLALATKTQQISLIAALKKLLSLYHYLSDKKPSFDQAIRQRDFMELLQKLKNDDINDNVQLEKHLQKTAVFRGLKNIMQLNIFKFQLNVPHRSTRYYDIRTVINT